MGRVRDRHWVLRGMVEAGKRLKVPKAEDYVAVVGLKHSQMLRGRMAETFPA